MRVLGASARLGSLLGLCSAIGCGGTQASPPDASAGAQAPGADLLGPADTDPCTVSAGFTFWPIASFGPDNSANPDHAQNTTIYVSYDGSGTLYQASCSPAALATNTPCSEMPALPAHPFLCSACAQDPDASNCTGCGCASGYSPGITGEPPPQPRCGGSDNQALHLHADSDNPEGLTLWGMNVGIELRQNCTTPNGGMPDAGSPEAGKPCYFDATEWTGLSFWALLGPQNTGSQVLLATVGDRDTSGQLGGGTSAGSPPTPLAYPFNDLRCGDPPCTAGLGTATPSGRPQCDPYGKGVGLVNHWEFYAIPFSEMRQKGYGKPDPVLDLTHILGVKFGLGKGAWDVWLDDIAFYKSKNP